MLFLKSFICFSKSRSFSVQILCSSSAAPLVSSLADKSIEALKTICTVTFWHAGSLKPIGSDKQQKQQVLLPLLRASGSTKEKARGDSGKRKAFITTSANLFGYFHMNSKSYIDIDCQCQCT